MFACVIKSISNYFQSTLSKLYWLLYNEFSTKFPSSIWIVNWIIIWSEPEFFSLISQKICSLLLRFLEAKVKSMIEVFDLVHVCWSGSFNRSNSYFSSQSISLLAFLGFVIVEFHHEWWAFKSPHKIAFLLEIISCSFLLTVYSLQSSFNDLSL